MEEAMAEVFDVVDERDVVIGCAAREEVHRQGLRHRAVHILVLNGRGELFLQKRSATKDCFPGVWDSSAAGHLDRGEEYDAAAAREAREELGWQPPGPLERLFKVEACPETGQEFVWVYQGRAEGPFRLHPEEIETGGWFGLDEVDAWVAARPTEFAPSFPLIWREVRRRGGPL